MIHTNLDAVVSFPYSVIAYRAEVTAATCLKALPEWHYYCIANHRHAPVKRFERAAEPPRCPECGAEMAAAFMAGGVGNWSDEDRSVDE